MSVIILPADPPEHLVPAQKGEVQTLVPKVQIYRYNIRGSDPGPYSTDLQV